jgi:hypothetical protein
MRRLAWVLVLGLAAVVPAVGLEPPVVQLEQLQPIPPLAPGGGRAEAAPIAGYVAPKADGPVVELLDEGIEPLFAQLINDGGNEPGTIAREDRDVFAGVEAARVTPMQKYCSNIPGWAFKIVEKPAKAGEFRFLRFAWKKIGGSGIMVQFHAPLSSWGFRYYSGQNVHGWQPATQVSARLPGEWELVTVDLFKQYGGFQMTGFAMTPFDGAAGLFDHVLLGRTVEDLDRATNEALGKVRPAQALAGKERDALWADLVGTDAKKAGAALRAFLAAAPDQVAFVRDRLDSAPDKDQAERVRKLVAQLGAEAFDAREAATADLIKLGPAVIDTVREAGRTAADDEVRFRCRVILKKLGGGTTGGAVGKSARLSRSVRVLERAGGAEARAVLAEIAEGKLAPEVASDAKAALARMPK